MSEWPDELVERVATVLLNENRRRHGWEPIPLTAPAAKALYLSQALTVLDALGPDVVYLPAEEQGALVALIDEALGDRQVAEDLRTFNPKIRRTRAALGGKRGGDDG